eukprot:7373841-Pyramimonas_sp.AAC.1
MACIAVTDRACPSEEYEYVYTFLGYLSALESSLLNFIGLLWRCSLSKGYRTIGIFSMLYRVSGKIRISYARAWMDKFDHPWFSCGPGRSPIDVVWRQSVRSEASKASGEASVGLLWDL